MKKDIFDDYVDRVTYRFGISRDQLFTKDKSRHLSDARHVLYYLCRQRPMTMAYIKQYMGDNGYDIAASNILHGVRKVEDNISKDSDYTTLINELK
jgi:chromosomal replication initiation ATPase DnaA